MARKTHFETLQEIEPLLEELRKEQKLEPVRWWKDVSIDDQAVVCFWEEKYCLIVNADELPQS